MSFKYTFLKCFLINVHTEAVQAVLAVIIADHLPRECPLLFLGVVYYPYASNVYLLVEFRPILNGNQFFNISDPEFILEFQRPILIQVLKVVPTIIQVLEKKLIPLFPFKVLLVRTI